jgi:hypothetical protein
MSLLSQEALLPIFTTHPVGCSVSFHRFGQLNKNHGFMKCSLTVSALLLSVFVNLNAQNLANDASIYKILVPAYTEFKSIIWTGVFKNSGADTLHSVIINVKIDNGTVTQLAQTGLKVSRNQTWPFSAPAILNLTKEGKTVIKAWTSLPNGVEDQNHANDTLVQTIQVIEKYPEKSILIEEVTGAWCGYCPRAPIIYNVNVRPAYPKTIFTALHTGDGMAISEANDFKNTYVTGVPTGFVDRKKTQTDAGITFAPESWQTLLANLDNKFTPVDLKVYNYYDPATRNWKIDVVGDFVFDVTANYRMNCYIIEDSLYGTGSAWDQRNFFNGGASSPYQSLQGAGDPIPGYRHNHVIRKMLGGSWGQSGIIPASVKKGERYVYSQTFKADVKWNMDHVHLVGIVQQWDTDIFKRPIINAVEGEVKLLTGTSPLELNPRFHLFPNPASETVWIEFNSASLSGAIIQVINATGQKVYSRTLADQTGNLSVPVSLKSMAPGIYFVRLVTAQKVFVERLIKE